MYARNILYFIPKGSIQGEGLICHKLQAGQDKYPLGHHSGKATGVPQATTALESGGSYPHIHRAHVQARVTSQQELHSHLF